MKIPRYKHTIASNIHHKLLCRHSEHRRSYQKDVWVLVFIFCACDVKIRHFRWPNTASHSASHPEFIAYIVLRCYSNVDAKTRFDFIWELITRKKSNNKKVLKVLYVVFISFLMVHVIFVAIECKISLAVIYAI